MAVRVVKQVQSFNGIPSLISKIHAENFDISKCKKAVVLIPGNPGIIRFYDSFLESLFIECKGEIPMFGIQHAGLVYFIQFLFKCTNYPYLPINCGYHYKHYRAVDDRQPSVVRVRKLCY